LVFTQFYIRRRILLFCYVFIGFFIRLSETSCNHRAKLKLVKISKWFVNFYFITSLMFGLYIGWKLFFFKNFQYLKLVNLTGLVCDILAVILLSYVVLAKDFVQSQVAHKISMFVIIFSAVFPAAIMGGTLLSSFFGSTTNNDIKIYMVIFACVTIIPIRYLFGSPTFEPVGQISFKPEKRIKILGTILLLMGFLFQFIAAFGDLIQGA